MSKLLFATTICVLVLANASAVFAEELSPSALTEVLRNSKIIKPDRSLRLSVSGRKVLILTDRNLKASDKDCQIDAVLLAKSLVDTYPDQVTRVMVLFSRQNSDKITQINVTAGDVKAFGSGQISEDALLSSLDMQEVSALSADSGNADKGATTNLAPGPFMEKRLILVHQIDELESKGTGVKPFRDLFSKIEADITKGDEKSAADDIRYLAEKLGEQAKLLKQVSTSEKAMHSASSSATSSNTTSSGTTSANLPQTAALLERCKQWDRKLNQWRSEGRDVTQLIASIAIIRGFSADPSKYAMAKSMLDAMDAMINQPPPISGHE